MESLLGKRQQSFYRVEKNKLKSSQKEAQNKQKLPTAFWNNKIAEIVNKYALGNTDFSDSDFEFETKSWFRVSSKRSKESLVKHCLWKDILEANASRLSEKDITAAKKVRKKVKACARTDNNLPKMEEKEEEEETKPLKMLKLRIFPRGEEKSTLIQWLRASMWTYNSCLRAIESKKVKRSKRELREMFINKSSFSTKTKWLEKTPYDVRDESMADLLKNYQSNIAKKMKGVSELKKFKMKPRSFTDPQLSIVIRARYWEQKSGIYSFLKGIKTEFTNRKNKRFPEIKHDFRILRTRLGRWYFCIPMDIEIKEENPLTKIKVCALDPGVRKFMTTYDDTGQATMWGPNDISRIHNLCKRYDNLQSQWSTPEITRVQKHFLRKQGRRIQFKIRNLIDDMHRRLAKWLCENHRVILLPEFETQNMVKKEKSEKQNKKNQEISTFIEDINNDTDEFLLKKKRCLSTKTTRNMLTWSHYRFKQHLLHKGREYPLCLIQIVDEAYTSKTCGNCGFVNKKFSSEIFKCQKCQWTIDRDINGARNILLRYLSGLFC